MFRRIALAAACLAALVVVLGAWVRLTDAGLGCPDWPGCYGHLHPAQAAGDVAGQQAFPSRRFDYAKALHEMVHRYFATGLGFGIASLLVLAFWNRKDPAQPVRPVLLLFLLVCLQGALGAFTVTLLLKPLIVTSHLLGGLTTLGLLVWLAWRPERRAPLEADLRLRRFALLGLSVLAVQIALGGWTSTNYASVACPDFPTCQGSFWPHMDFRNAFVLWRGLGIDYEGGVLAAPARVAIHFTHRLGAVVAGGVLIALGLRAWFGGASRRVKGTAALLLCAVVLQIGLGVSTVLLGVPLAVATAHNAGAALLVIAMVSLLRALWPERAGTAAPRNP
ncbi:MAG: COX15/CtaA family protein [Proteobacteria bacterium]|nr:COX15/CtaA family protein [Pseudomonadota bacterium]